MTRIILIALATAAILAPQAAAAPAFGCPPALASFDFADIRNCHGTQGWWVEGRTDLRVPAADFPFTSAHVHLDTAYPTGEKFLPNGAFYETPFLAQWFNFVGDTAHSVRTGNWSDNSCCISVPMNFKPASDHEERVGVLKVPCCSASGMFERRFTSDTESPFGKRMYQSGAWRAAFGTATPGPVGITARGWYASTGYTNVTLKRKTRASILASGGLPQTLSYKIGAGAKWAFAYIDPHIHDGHKGIVLFENRTGSSGSFTRPALEPGVHVLMLGAWEKAGDGWNAGVLRLPFRVEA